MDKRVFACWWLCAVLLIACGDKGGDDADESMSPATGQSGASGTPAMAAAGMAASGPMMVRAGSGAPPPVVGGMGAPASGGATSPGKTDAGTAGTAGSADDAGNAGSAGTDDEAGASGSAGSPGSGAMGPDPTADSASKAGPLNVDTISWTEFRDGPEFSGGTIWYPTDGEPPYPFVAIVPGFASLESSIAGWGPFLASHGIVAITIDTNTTGDVPAIRAGALLDALKSVAAENGRSGSPLQGKLDESRQGLMGWSMGGGGTLIAANETPTLKAAVSMCGWNPGGFYPMMTVPTLMFASLGDPLAGGQSQGFYQSIPEMTPKMLIEVGVGDHFVANDPSNLGGLIGRYGLSWLMTFLVGDDRYRQILLQMPEGTTDYASNVK